MRDPRVEQVLNSIPGLEWEYLSSIPLAKVNRDKSFANQVRIGKPIDNETVRQYMEAMRNGDDFPAPVFFIDSDQYETSDGNHRYEAKYRLGFATTDAYTVLCDDPVIRSALTYEWNELNGLPPTPEDRDRHIIHLVRQGMTQKSVAARKHVSARHVEEVLAEDAGHTRAMDLGVKAPWAKIPSRDARVKLHRDLPMDAPFAAAVRHVAKFGLTSRQVRDMTADVTAVRNEAEQVAVIQTKTREAQKELERQKAEKAGRKTKHRGQSPHWLFRAHLEYLAKQVQNKFEESVTTGLNSEERQALNDHIARTVTLLLQAQQKLMQ